METLIASIIAGIGPLVAAYLYKLRKSRELAAVREQNIWLEFLRYHYKTMMASQGRNPTSFEHDVKALWEGQRDQDEPKKEQGQLPF